ncbi:ribonuclease HII [Propionigenium maris DSM 9537]|uniref:Ribonuclease HII n=1 Tax=Propionigenium maris DSM 9537 TaxID=1123000 RepID=A0A9W6LMY6_9FUSO|nr:ribonuclease HII [Propionigenium maris]GLI55998.1 ribonuclease HII [Propionigenium maris DSM 9537]
MEMHEFDLEYGEIIGIDEAGRGPLAGPVVAAAVKIKNIVPEFEMINDSKKLTEKKREALYDVIMENCYVGVGVVGAETIDEINILNATFLAMRRAIEEVKDKGAEWELALVDGNHKIRKYEGEQLPVIKGDGKSLSIAAASIIAKVTRDRMMVEQGREFPNYLFEKHKGYGTKAHREAILENGPCKYHRMSFLGTILKPTLF